MTLAEYISNAISFAVAAVVIIGFFFGLFKWRGSEERYKETEERYKETMATLKAEMYKEIDKGDKRFNEQRNLLFILLVLLAVMLAMVFARNQVRDKSS